MHRSLHRLRDRLRRTDERGMALVTAIMVGFVVSMFTLSMMFVAFHDQTTSAHNRSYGQALHVAESGVHQAIAYLQNSSGAVPSTTVTGSTDEGTYQYRITAQARNRYQIDAVGTVGTASSTQGSRRLRITMAPPISFRYALFSLADVTTKNNNNVCGDVWANTFVSVSNNDAVRASTSSQCPSGGTAGSGNVTAATSYISTGNNSVIEGDAWSGGYSGTAGISIGGSVGGFAKASSSTPGCADDPSHLKYQINGGTVGGGATAWGTIGSSVSGTSSPSTCTAAAATKPIPTFTYNSANYPAATLHTYNFPTDYAAFNSYIAANSSNLSGTFYITGGGSSYPVDLAGATISGDLTVVATASPIDGSNGGLGSTGSADKIVVLASWYAPPSGNTGCTSTGGNPVVGECAISFKNNFTVSTSSLSGGSNTAVLLYAPNGPVAFKNNADFQGAVYANNIQSKNNMNVTYDARLDQIAGFGASTLDIEDWEECDPGAVTTTSCA